MDVIRLLNSKNRCLERFLTVSIEFLSAVDSGDFQNLDLFYRKRDRILKGFALYDQKLSECISALAESKTRLLSDASQQVEQALVKKSLLVKRIAEIDSSIVSAIEAEKTRIRDELTANQKSTNNVKKFKSSWVSESGDELDKTL